MTIGAVYQKGLQELQKNQIGDAEFDCMQLLQFVFSMDRSALVLHREDEANPELVRQFFEKICRRKEGEPLQYILGFWDFYDKTYFVGKGVLIPRPETETIVDMAREIIEEKKSRVVFDLCTGSGCIGLTLAGLYPSCQFYLVDISKDALFYAEKNRESYHLSNVEIFCGDIAEGYLGFQELPMPDLLLSNPPYIPSKEIATLQRELSFEPRTALDGGENGLDFYHILAKKWLPYVKKGGFVAVETGEEQTEEIERIFQSELHSTKRVLDAFGQPRFVCGIR